MGGVGTVGQFTLDQEFVQHSAQTSFEITSIEKAIRDSALGPDEITTRLIALSRDADPKVALSAIRELRAHLKDVLHLNGVVSQRRLERKLTNGPSSNNSGSIRETVTSNALIDRIAGGGPAPSAGAQGRLIPPSQSSGGGLPPARDPDDD